MTEESDSSNSGCLPKVSNSWRSLFEIRKGTNRIHPQHPVLPKDYEFIYIESKIRLGVVHVKPEKTRNSHLNINDISSKRSSLSEEYWFEKNRPKNTNCNCSFRRSKISVKELKSEDQESHSKINNIENYVDLLIEKTLDESLREYCQKSSFSGVENLAFENSDEKSPLRSNIHSPISLTTNSYKRCSHKKNTSKPLIIFIHGLGSTAEVWNFLSHNLVIKGFEIVAPDLLGHGYSSAPNKAGLYSFKNLLLQVLAVFDYFMENDDKRKCVLVGHSYGCSLITGLYPHRATQIAQLILISGGGPIPLAPQTDSNNISPYGCALNLCYPLLYCGLKRSFFYSSRGKNFKVCEDQNSVPNHIMEFLIKGQYWPEGDATFHRRIMVPTLLVHGLQDKNITLVQECEMERTIPRAYLELVPNAGHMSMVEAPEHLAHMIICFLEMWS